MKTVHTDVHVVSRSNKTICHLHRRTTITNIILVWHPHKGLKCAPAFIKTLLGDTNAGSSSTASHRIRAAYLVDPVDNSTFTPSSPQNPSAYDALKASGRAVGISGATVVGACNPKRSNFEVLSDLLAGFLRTLQIVISPI